MMTPAQCRAGRGLIRWNQNDLAREAAVSVVTVRNFENEKVAPQRATIDVMQRALEAAGVEFTNGRQPGVRPTPLWVLHRVAERANLDETLKMKGRKGYWIITPTATGLECKNQHGETMGRVEVERPDQPTPKFDPDMGEVTCVTSIELQRWIAEMLMRDGTRGRAARAFDQPAISPENQIAENGGGPGVRLKKRAKGVEEISQQIDVLEEKISSIPAPTTPSPEAAMNTMRKAVAESDLTKLKTRRKRIKNNDSK
jgi:transcriptional regulator with XRE-family HTH domain